MSHFRLRLSSAAVQGEKHLTEPAFQYAGKTPIQLFRRRASRKHPHWQKNLTVPLGGCTSSQHSRLEQGDCSEQVETRQTYLRNPTFQEWFQVQLRTMGYFKPRDTHCRWKYNRLQVPELR